MGQAQGTNAYPSARVLLDRALESEKGIRVKFESAKKAFRFRMNCYTVRKRERENSVRIYDSTHPMHGHSPWDHLELLLEEEFLIIRVTHGDDEFSIQEIK